MTVPQPVPQAPLMAPAKTPTDATLRARLKRAIDRQASLDRAAAAKRTVAKEAARLTGEAAAHVEKLRAAQQSRMSEVRAAHAKSISDALRREKPLPPRPSPAPTDIVALDAAVEQFAAFEVSATELDLEAQAAEQEAGKGRAEVEGLVSAILDGEGWTIGREIIALTERTHALMDRLSGLALRDEKRPGGPILHDMQRELLAQIDRRKAAVRRNPLYIEEHNYRNFLADLYAAQEVKWADYAARLAKDADAQFEPEVA